MEKDHKHHNIASFEKEGFFIVKGLLNTREVADINLEFHQEWLKLVAKGEIKQEPDRPLETLFPRLRDFHLHNEKILEYLLNPKITNVVREAIGDEPLVVSTSYFFKPPGAKGLPLHQDNFSVGVSPGTTFSVWISLSESYPENGGMVVVPKSHRVGILQPKSVSKDEYSYAEELPLPEGYETLPLTTTPGDVICFSGDLLHSSLVNQTTDRFRHAFLIHFSSSKLEKVLINYNRLFSSDGKRVRRKLNTNFWDMYSGSGRKKEWSGVTLNN
ncbi:phytanoyl-CoA dioxygenase family protein [Bacillus infantis]|uniref:Phytanoyl-CoA dioxygenase family protein n=1 Tax=Bacillus infantis TaxID=324767 RepID=A0A5D4SD80_9BACI|nr:phytanoyl-CoA dioxygenase family protein [Bacillus infantis]TYS60631.1 phytanoyl-CoA dioxygenase family protein [Bacillus infantis]